MSKRRIAALLVATACIVAIVAFLRTNERPAVPIIGFWRIDELDPSPWFQESRKVEFGEELTYRYIWDLYGTPIVEEGAWSAQNVNHSTVIVKFEPRRSDLENFFPKGPDQGKLRGRYEWVLTTDDLGPISGTDKSGRLPPFYLMRREARRIPVPRRVD